MTIISWRSASAISQIWGCKVKVTWSEGRSKADVLIPLFQFPCGSVPLGGRLLFLSKRPSENKDASKEAVVTLNTHNPSR